MHIEASWLSTTGNTNTPAQILQTDVVYMYMEYSFIFDGEILVQFPIPQPTDDT